MEAEKAHQLPQQAGLVLAMRQDTLQTAGESRFFGMKIVPVHLWSSLVQTPRTAKKFSSVRKCNFTSKEVMQTDESSFWVCLANPGDCCSS